MRCYRDVAAPSTSCTARVGEALASCRIEADGKVSECFVSVDGGGRTTPHGKQCWAAAAEVGSCVVKVIEASRAPALTRQSEEKKGQFTTGSIRFHPIE
jgi:hypothetical protein